MNAIPRLQGSPNLAIDPLMAAVREHIRARLPTIVTVLMAIIVACQAGRLTWLAWPKPATALSLPNPAPAVTDVRPSVVDVQSIVDAHLFGLPQAGAGDGDGSNAPTTQIPLVLVGVMAAQDPTKGFAFIGDSATTAKFHLVGDELTGAAHLHSVYVDRVVLDRAGRLESLWLPRFSGDAPSASTATSLPGRVANTQRSGTRSDRDAFGGLIRPQAAVDESGAFQGIRLFPGRHRQEFRRMGLEAGDVVTSVNGTRLTNQTVANQALNDIANGSQSALTIVRNGQVQQLDLSATRSTVPIRTERVSPPQSARARLPNNGSQEQE